MSYFNPTFYDGLMPGPIYGTVAESFEEAGTYQCCCAVPGGGFVCIDCNDALFEFHETIDIFSLGAGLVPPPDFINVRIDSRVLTIGGNVGCGPCLPPIPAPTCGAGVDYVGEHSFSGDGGSLLLDAGSGSDKRAVVGWFARELDNLAYNGNPDNDAQRLLFPFDTLTAIQWDVYGGWHRHNSSAEITIRSFYFAEATEDQNPMMVV